MPPWEKTNLLCYGDNLGFLTDTSLFPDECVDLIYLDPPFNSQQSYNVLFKEASGTPAAAQIKAFEDTWTWDMAANEALTQIHNDRAVPAPLVELMKTFMQFLKASPMMAYLVQMGIRLVHMHRVLKRTGALYLHCDPTASHYLKLVLDAIFGAIQFRNEIIWRRSKPHGNVYKRYGSIHDVLLFYVKTDEATWTRPHVRYDQMSGEDLDRVHAQYSLVDEDGRRFQATSLLNPNPDRPNLTYEFHGHTKVWRWTQERMKQAEREGRLHFPKGGKGIPREKRYLDEQEGIPLQDIWSDKEVKAIPAQSTERLGYPTQKPLGLLLRVVAASSNPGDLILDPFCGCGTTIDAVETINRENPREEPRRWIGIDVTHLSINLIKHRLTRFTDPPVAYDVIGEPTSVSDAEALAQDDPFQFQFWALGLIGARPIGGQKKKGADRGIDGVLYFVDEMRGNQPVTKTMLVQVKSGRVGVKHIRDFVGTLTRESAEMGVFITLEKPTKAMRTEAAAGGTYTSPWDKKSYPKIQILTVEELLADPQRPNPRCLRMPGGYSGPSHTFPNPARHKQKRDRQGKLYSDGQ